LPCTHAISAPSPIARAATFPRNETHPLPQPTLAEHAPSIPRKPQPAPPPSRRARRETERHLHQRSDQEAARIRLYVINAPRNTGVPPVHCVTDAQNLSHPRTTAITICRS